jgi:glycosyltransferase involved in cell wall biosynthesis
VRVLQHPLPSPLAAADDLIGAIRNWAYCRQHTQPRESASIQCEPFDAAAAYTVATGDVPERIAVVGPRDLELARNVISVHAASSDPLQDLRSWKRFAIDARLDRRRTPLDERPRRPSRSRHATVTFIANPSTFTGPEQSLCQLVRHLDHSRFALTALIGAEGVFAERLREAGVEVHCAGQGFGGEHDIDDFYYVMRELSSIRPDIVHFNGASGQPAIHAVAAMGAPIVVHCRNAGLERQREQLHAADRLIAVSEFAKRHAMMYDVPGERIAVIHDEVDTDYFDPSRVDRVAARHWLGVPDDALVLLMIARFVPVKRHDRLFAVLDRIKQAVPRLHVVLNGEVHGPGEIYDSIREHVIRNGMRQWITFVPFVADVRQLHVAADALILCSDGEALGRCVVEAMAMQRPVIVTDSGGTTEIVRHRETGFVVRAGDANMLAEQLVEVLTNVPLAARVAASAREYAMKSLTARSSARAVANIYEELLLDRHVGAAAEGRSREHHLLLSRDRSPRDALRRTMPRLPVEPD